MVGAGLAALVVGAGALRAGPIAVPNASFELPVAGGISGFPVDLRVDKWEKAPAPPWYEAFEEDFPWDQHVGIFRNSAPAVPDHIINMNGAQAAWLFAVPDVALFQDYNSTDHANKPNPLHEFNARFEVGKSYTLTVAVLGGNGNMLEGVSLEMSLYYRNISNNRVNVASTSVVHSYDAFPTNTQFFDYQVRLPVVKPGDPWAGQYIGIQFLSTVSYENRGGYWDLDNVRLSETAEPMLQVTRSGANARVAWLAAPGYQYQLKMSTPVIGSWQNYEAPVTGTGTGTEVVKFYPLANGPSAFFRLVITPAP